MMIQTLCVCNISKSPWTLHSYTSTSACTCRSPISWITSSWTFCEKYCGNVLKMWWASNGNKSPESKKCQTRVSAELPFFTWYVHANTSWWRCRYVGFDYWCKLSQDLFQTLQATANVAKTSNSQVNGNYQSTFCTSTRCNCQYKISTTAAEIDQDCKLISYSCLQMNC